MSIKNKLKSVFGNTKSKAVKTAATRKNKTDSELSADEVAHEEVFPKKTVCNKKATGSAADKPASKRTRPTNDNYRMIDPNDGTCDSSKS